MSIFHASFQKARSGMLTNICEIEKVVELTDEEYERFSQNLTVSSPTDSEWTNTASQDACSLWQKAVRTAPWY